MIRFSGAITLSRGSTAPASTRKPPCTPRTTANWNIHCPASLNTTATATTTADDCRPTPHFKSKIACQKRLFPFPAKRQCSFPCLPMPMPLPCPSETYSRLVSSRLVSSHHKFFLLVNIASIRASHIPIPKLFPTLRNARMSRPRSPAPLTFPTPPLHNTNAAQPFLSSGKCGWAISRPFPQTTPHRTPNLFLHAQT